jgi:hypothetical protein
MSKEITSIFAVYHKARVTFAQTAAELAKQSRNIEGISEFRFIKIEAMIIKEPGLLELLRPLLLDIEPSVQQNAAKALGFIAGYNEQLGERVVSSDILPQLVYSLHNDNVTFFLVIIISETIQKICCFGFKKCGETHNGIGRESSRVWSN